MGEITTDFPKAVLAEICRRHGVRELAVFGSALGETFSADSDFDLLVEFREGAGTGILGFTRMQHELEDALGRKVDLVSKNGLNPVIRDEVLASAKVVYAQ